jgi:hypothetical protein
VVFGEPAPQIGNRREEDRFWHGPMPPAPIATDPTAIVGSREFVVQDLDVSLQLV